MSSSNLSAACLRAWVGAVLRFVEGVQHEFFGLEGEDEALERHAESPFRL